MDKAAPKPAVSAKHRILSSLVPVLALMVIVSTFMVIKWRGEYGRLAREKKGRTLSLPLLEKARELVERAEKHARLSPPDFDDLQGMAQEAVDVAGRALHRAAEFGVEIEEGYRLRGRALELTYNFDEARADYEKSIELHPESPARYHLGMLSLRQLARARLAGMKTALLDEDTLRARVTEPLRRFQATSPEFNFSVDDKFRFLSSTAIAYAMADMKAVLPQAGTAMGFDATEWIPPYLRGIARLELKELPEAVKDLEAAVRLAPGVADGYAWLGLALSRAGRRTAAIEALSTALQASEHFLEAYLVRGTLLYEDGRFADARADFEACAKLRPSLPEVHFKHGIASYESWQRGGRTNAADLDAAIEAFTRCVNARPKDPEAYVHRARARLAKKDFAAAEADLVMALGLAPAHLEAHELRAEACEARLKWADAEKEWTAIAEKSTDAARAAQALRRRARVRVRAVRPDDALADYDELLKRDPNDAGLYVEKGGLQLMAGRADDAMATAGKALALNPRHARALALRAEVFLKKDDAAAAIREATQAFEADPQLADALVTRGKAFLARGNKGEAAADWRKALELRPDLKEELAPWMEKTGP
jgi:tetratricopeptide (TPR) repeat protein